ncbi:hypothetical protein SAZ_42545 [Streptomyces noursei ZPM]|nr:hypothetical protein SAZ_00260 [Streptomyces noursei ZPM]AKA09313.1 hypothetical protein SAZ_42545 [Streptomyces noursei ZPM]EOT05062.2 hypothetical protein K530_05415 [Streptomyces noursei CCRC 11814]EXU92462.1 hypothetical protein P354_21315 [Streptomyces noursei PD-1]
MEAPVSQTVQHPEAVPTRGRSVLEGFDEWVAAAPDHPAFVAGKTTLSFGELDRLSNRLAWALREQGVRPGHVVGLCLRRDVRLAVALLAVIKAGGAYLPVEPHHPTERQRAVLTDAEATLLLTDSPASKAEGASAGGIPMLSVDFEALSDFPVEAPPREAGPDDLLYVLYTSGSTGKPKGIAMHHAPQVRLLNWCRTQYAEAPRALQYFPVTADVASLELLLTWWTGGCAVMASENDRYDITAVARLIREQQITRILLPVAAMQQLARHAETHPDDIASLRELITTGDRLVITPEIHRMCGQLPDVIFDDHYGSTEVNVVAAPRLTAPTSLWPDRPRLGRPLSLGRTYVLDTNLQPVPPNVPGEIYVGGGPCAYGYIGEGALTAAAFVPDPFAQTPGARMYRTGDRGVWRRGGELEFLGRSDFQIKFRGYRIEPGEVEAVLSELDVVSKAVVTAVHPAGDEEPLLAAYVVPAPLPPGVVVQTELLRDHLASRLPSFMVPQAFILLDRLPLTETGKVDRAQLPLPDQVEPEFVAPRDETEASIAAIWAEALGLEQVGVRHNFFWLGGHSLLVTRVVYQIRQALGVEVPLSWLFQRPTVEALAAALRETAGDRQR